MADTVNTDTVHDGLYRQTVHLTNESDGTGESAVAKVDISTKTHGGPNGIAATYSVIDLIEYSVSGFNYVVLEWDHTTNDEIAVLSGQGVVDWRDVGGKADPQSGGGTGDILLTTDGALDGAHYDITIHYRPRA